MIRTAKGPWPDSAPQGLLDEAAMFAGPARYHYQQNTHAKNIRFQTLPSETSALRALTLSSRV